MCWENANFAILLLIIPMRELHTTQYLLTTSFIATAASWQRRPPRLREYKMHETISVPKNMNFKVCANKSAKQVCAQSHYDCVLTKWVSSTDNPILWVGLWLIKNAWIHYQHKFSIRPFLLLCNNVPWGMSISTQNYVVWKVSTQMTCLCGNLPPLCVLFKERLPTLWT